MLKPTRIFLGLGSFVFVLALIPLSASVSFKSSVYSALKYPISLSRDTVQLAADLFFFRKNAHENKELKKMLAGVRLEQLQSQELLLENRRLARLLDLKQGLSKDVQRAVVGRVIGRSPLAWNRVFLIDKGIRQGVRVNMLVMSDQSLVGKIIEAGPSVSKALLITDPGSRLGVMIQRTRQQGILFGVLSGECRMKYISIDAEVKIGDAVETAGFERSSARHWPVGKVNKVWKEPGQIYQVAEVKPLTDLGRIEEVVVFE